MAMAMANPAGTGPGTMPRPAGGGLVPLTRERPARLGAKTFLEHARSGQSLSFGELEQASVAWLGVFEESGIKVGTTVALAMSDPLEFSAAFLAIIASGRWVAPLDPASPVQGTSGLAAALDRVQASIVVADCQRPPGIDAAWRV